MLKNAEMEEEELHEAKVVSIYKKGDSAKLESYRSISLLQTLYKNYACCIKERIDAAIDRFLTSTQYGFRRNRLTAHAIFLARRFLDISERIGKSLA